MSKSKHTFSHRFVDGDSHHRMKHESCRNSKELIREELNDPDEVADKGLGLQKPVSTMRKLRYEKGERVIPWGDYCYDSKGCCPYWDVALNKEKQNNGFCWFLGKGDWTEDSFFDLLWDQCKCCGKKEDLPAGKLPLYEEEEYDTI